VRHETGVLIEINCIQLAIVLLNQDGPEVALGPPSTTYEDQRETLLWQQHAVIYQMGKYTF
ncbi:unnamed protein product, partial [Rotaria sp. Silwood2]